MGYRKDIQILRGVAVLLVVFFHLGLMNFQSGFLGVDVFFTISGFLMAVMYDHNDKKAFIKRRALRLLPAYYVTVVLTIIVSIIILLPKEYYLLFEEAIYANSFITNIIHWIKSSYFSKSEFKPLLHLWSLGVEIQYYLIVPILFLFFRMSQWYFWLFFLGSLFLCFYLVETNPQASFFLMPLRAWEFLLGHGVARYLTVNGNILSKTSTKQNIGSTFFFIIIAIPLLKVKETHSFITGHPGIFALLITFSTGAVIALGINNHFENSPLGSLLELIGKYSYSIYLIHFPVIVLYLYKPFQGTNLEIRNIYDLLFLITIISILSIGMYHLIEIKLKQHKKIKVILLAFPIVIIVLAGFGYNIQKYFYTKEEMYILDSYRDRSCFRCGRTYSLLHRNSITCRITTTNNNSNHNLILVGNSYADAIKTKFANVASRMNTSVYFIIPNNPLMKNSSIHSDTIIDEAIKLNASSIVLHYSFDRITGSVVKELVSLAKSKNIFVSYIMPPPLFKKHIPMALWEHKKYNKELEKLTIEDYKKRSKILRNSLLEIKLENFKFYEVYSYFCNEECSLADPLGKPLYFDNGHLTLTGSSIMIDLFKIIISDCNSYKNILQD